MKRILKTTLIATALAFTFSSPLLAKEVASVSEARQETARHLAALINDEAFGSALRGQLDRQNTAMLADVLHDYASGRTDHSTSGALTEIDDLERQAIRMRGLDGALDDLFDIRVHGVAKGQAVSSARAMWVGTIVKHKSTGQEELVAFDASGTEHRFPLDAAPNVPMLLVESENAQVTRAGIEVMNSVMQRGGIQDLTAKNSRRSAEPEELTLLQAIYLEEDMEPYQWKGTPEIFAVVSGIAPDGKAQVITKQMPWLDTDKKWFSPKNGNGLDLITWRNFGTNYVNVEFWEEDGELNFRDLALGIIDGAGSFANLLAPGVPTALVTAGVRLVADQVFNVLDKVNAKPDYIDSIYVIERGGNYGTMANPLVGFRGYAKMVLKPYEVKGSSLKDYVPKVDDNKIE